MKCSVFVTNLLLVHYLPYFTTEKASKTGAKRLVNHKERILRGVLLVGAFLAVLGWWLPWVSARSGAAALVLLGLDFSDFWKFTNEWRDLSLFQVERLSFVLPPPLVAMILAFWGNQNKFSWRLFWLPLLLFLSVVILPAYEYVQITLEGTPFVYDDPGYAREFSFQFYFAILSLIIVLSISSLPALNHRVRYGFITLLALIGTLLPPWALWRTWLVLQGFYGGHAQLNLGAFVTSGGFLLVALSALYLGFLTQHRNSTQSPSQETT